MMHRLHRALAFLLCLGVGLGLAACTSSDAISAAHAQRMQELGAAFVTELEKDFIPNREKPEKLKAMDAVVVDGDKTYNLSLLYAFYDDYKVGQNTQVTTTISTSVFVVTRVVFEGSNGYYFRYEFDKFNEKSITVSSQPLDKISITEDPKVGKVELTLKKEKRSDLVFSFKNIVDEESPASKK